MSSIYKFIEGYKRISIIGMEKNVGKTTLLNKLISDIGNKKKIAITSIGRDGEEIDVVTSTDKPRIYVRRGTIIATGKDCLSNCDITKEILYVTDFTTPMGSIVIVRALSDGYVDIAGPSYNAQIKEIIQKIEEFGVDLSIIDGALGRKSTAISEVCDATIMSTGAALSVDMIKVIEETKKNVNFLMLEEIEKELKESIKEYFKETKVLLITKNMKKQTLNVNNSIDLAKDIKQYLDKDLKFLCIRGAITPKIIEALIENRGSYEKLTLVCEDGTKIFIDTLLYRKAQMSEIEFKVVEKINLLFVTCNPYSPLGINFPKKEFKEKLQREIKVPVIDVLGESDEFY